MQNFFRHPVAKILICTLCLVLGIAYLALASSEYIAYRFAEKPELKSLQFSIRLEPWNASYHYRLGRLLALMQRPEEAAIAFDKAVSINPSDARSLIALASENFVLGLQQAGNDRVRDALAADPKNPNLAFTAANLYLAEGDLHSALHEFRNALEGAPSLSSQIIPLCWQAIPNADLLLREALPESRDVYSFFLEFLLSKREAESTAKAWARIVKMGQPAKLSDVFDYVRYLVGERRPAEAKIVWEQAGPLCDLQPYQPARDNLVVNGDFTQNVLNGGFDWSNEKRSDVTLTLDSQEPHLGPHPLMISYDSGGLKDAGIRQAIPVRRDSIYHFTAYFKTRELKGAGGPRFSLEDFYTGKTYFESADLKDSESWSLVNGEFKTDSTTQLLVLEIKRVPAGAAIKGQLWIDGVRLKPEENIQ